VVVGGKKKGNWGGLTSIPRGEKQRLSARGISRKKGRRVAVERGMGAGVDVEKQDREEIL